jgi:hypothetical protein
MGGKRLEGWKGKKNQGKKDALIIYNRQFAKNPTLNTTLHQRKFNNLISSKP